MTKIYLKIFAGFWIINILTVIGQNMYVHWVGPDYESMVLSRYETDPTDKFAVRGLNLTVDALTHYQLDELRVGIPRTNEIVFRKAHIFS